MSNLYILSIGGSLIAPDEIQVDFLKKIKNVLEKKIAPRTASAELRRGAARFAIVVGGGGAARKYQKALKEFNVNAAGLDEVGIAATRLNATLLRLALWPMAGNSIFLSPEDVEFENEQIVIGGGWKPGWSTDYVAVLLAKKFGADCVVNFSNIDYVYTKDP
ncbi:UMP kinase, partial [Candidatus Falkowbacteria bacterium]|nr:UMP kinase [Candidatus Falkowbacteria bacterium]